MHNSYIVDSREGDSTYSEPKNHLSVPRRSERAETAARYCDSTVGIGICTPYGGRSELNPDSGAAGGTSSVSIGRDAVSDGEKIDCMNECSGWLTT